MNAAYLRSLLLCASHSNLHLPDKLEILADDLFCHCNKWLAPSSRPIILQHITYGRSVGDTQTHKLSYMQLLGNSTEHVLQKRLPPSAVMASKIRVS